MKLLYNGPSFRELHEEYAKKGRIDGRAQIIASASIDINASAEKVWQKLIDVAAYPSFDNNFSAVKTSEIAVDQPLSFKIKGFPIHATIAVAEPLREFSWTGKSLWTKAVDRHVIEKLDSNRTRLYIEESLAGAFVPLMFSAKQLEQQHQKWLEGIKQAIETEQA